MKVSTTGIIKATIPFIWSGFVAAISFMEAWLKFRAPGVTLAIGLSIGKLVFTALNRIEIVFALAILSTLFVSHSKSRSTEIFLLIGVGILFIQSVWILPQLSTRINIYLSGKTPSPSNIHFYFILLEAMKLIALLIYGFKQLTNGKYNENNSWGNRNEKLQNSGSI